MLVKTGGLKDLNTRCRTDKNEVRPLWSLQWAPSWSHPEWFNLRARTSVWFWWGWGLHKRAWAWRVVCLSSDLFYCTVFVLCFFCIFYVVQFYTRCILFHAFVLFFCSMYFYFKHLSFLSEWFLFKIWNFAWYCRQLSILEYCPPSQRVKITLSEDYYFKIHTPPTHSPWP